MKIKTLNRGEAQKAMNEWIVNYPELPPLDIELSSVRNDIQELNKKVRFDAENNANVKKFDYYIDAHFGLMLYEYLWKQPWFSMRIAANDGFWRYMSLKIVPDVVAQRWGKDNESHFWSRPTRIWLRSIWWYVHLAWQKNAETTRIVLECPHFTTDTILNFEERSGRNGTYVEAYRRIIYYYSKVSSGDIKKNSRGKANTSDDVFRVVMKLNTAKMLVMDPALCLGGEDAYAKALFCDAGVVLNVT